MKPTSHLRLAAVLTLTLIASTTSAQQAPTSNPGPPVSFEISFPASVHAQPITGRVYVMITRNSEREPRLQLSQVDGIPFFGRDIDQIEPGEVVVIDHTDLGFPVDSLRDIPDGEYFVQAFVNIYTRYPRADGNVVWMHEDQWEGQRWWVSPRNLHSPVQRLRLDASQGYRIQLVADQEVPPVTVPPDTEWVKRFSFISPMLSEFWGRPIRLGATVLLPRDYDRETIDYPVVYRQGHFSLNAPLRFREGTELYEAWVADDFPRMIVVTFQHPNPYYDDSYAVNSANVGPYGDALLDELIPETERRFRIIREPYARLLEGGSTGGWEALALQLFHPDFFGGTWCYCPDPVTFSAYESVDIYTDTNAFYKQHEWYRVPTPNIRDPLGRVRLTVEQKNRFEYVNGTKGRSGRQMDIWSAVFGPVGADGYFEPLFDKLTGEINDDVAAYWKEHYDLLAYMQRHWAALGPKIVDKLHIYTGDMDTYYLDVGVVLLERWMQQTTDPHYPGFFMYGDREPHCWSGPVTQAERLREMAEFVLRRQPDGVTAPWWPGAPLRRQVHSSSDSMKRVVSSSIGMSFTSSPTTQRAPTGCSRK